MFRIDNITKKGRQPDITPLPGEIHSTTHVMRAAATTTKIKAEYESSGLTTHFWEIQGIEECVKCTIDAVSSIKTMGNFKSNNSSYCQKLQGEKKKRKRLEEIYRLKELKQIQQLQFYDIIFIQNTRNKMHKHYLKRYFLILRNYHSF